MLVTGGIARSFLAFAPYEGRRWPLGLEAALATALPIAAATALGRTELGLVSALGAFTALYASDLARPARAQVLPLVAASLLGCAALGAVLATSLVATLAGLVLVTVAATWLALATRLGPPGAMMFALVHGASARIAAPAETGGGGIPPWLAILLVAVGAAAAYGIVVAPLALPAVRRRQPETPPFRALVARHPLTRHERVTLARVAAAVAVAAVASVPLGSHRAYWIVVAVVAVVQAGRARRHSAVRALHRVVGTFAGLGAFALLAFARPAGYLLALVLGALQFATELLVVRHYALALVVVTPLALTVTAAASTADPATVALERLVDTVVGVALGCLALLVPEGRAADRPTR